VVFDYGGVLCHPPTPGEIEELARIFDLPQAKFWSLYGRFRAAYDRGSIGAEEYWGRMANCAAVRLSSREIEALRLRDLRMWSRLNEPVIQLARELHSAGFKTGILSNMHAEFLAIVRDQFGILDAFDAQVFSCEAGLVKPEDAIYLRMVEELGVEPEQILFIDDLSANILGARRCGLHGIVFQSVNQLRSEMIPYLNSLAA
jgi:putative hydrolase of the HAD superfamily